MNEKEQIDKFYTKVVGDFLDKEISVDKTVEQRAYEIWDANGRPLGRDQEFWDQAVKETNTDSLKFGSDGNLSDEDLKAVKAETAASQAQIKREIEYLQSRGIIEADETDYGGRKRSASGPPMDRIQPAESFSKEKIQWDKVGIVAAIVVVVLVIAYFLG